MLIAKAASYLIRWDWNVRVRSFQRVYQSVRDYPVAACSFAKDGIDEVVEALGAASIWYYKRVLCYQRSGCLVWMLRDRGVPAQLVIGAQQWPPRTHAWVTVNQQVIGDAEYRTTRFDVMDIL